MMHCLLLVRVAFSKYKLWCITEEAPQIIREKSKVSGSNVKTCLGLSKLLNNAQFSAPICSSGAAQQKTAKGCL